MSSESILSAFQSAFPTLYTPPPEEHTADGGPEDGSHAAPEPAAAAPISNGDVAHDGAAEQQQQQQTVQRTSSASSSTPADPYSKKIDKITSKFHKTRVSADELETYLKSKEQEAKEAESRALARADEEFTPAWRDTGLPMKPSHLRLDQGKMSGARLVNPKAIMGQYQDLKTKEVFQPPHIYEYNDTSIQANYLKTTKNLQNRESMLLPETLERAKELSLKSRTWHLLDEAEVKQRVAASEERRRVQDLKMPATQYDLEKKIIHSMHHKLSFLRNPRYPLPPAVKLLQSQFKEGARWNVPDTQRPMPAIKANMTTKPDVVFVVEPEVVTFTDYEVGGVYTTRVLIRNVTGVIRSLRVLPPASQYFHMSLPRFPTEQGIVAPGMHAEVTLRFCPDSLADFDDEFAVDTAGLRFSVKVQARRPPPSLTLPHELQLGDVLVGNRKGAQFTFANLGGQGCFRVIPEALWPERYAEAPVDIARVGPFELWPLYLNLAPGDQAEINVGFEPHEMGTHEGRFILVCDNCQVKDFVVSGVACNVDIVLETIDGKPVRPGQLDSPLWFGEVVPGSGFTKRLSMRNTTTLPFPFQWHQAMHPQTRPARPANDGGLSTGRRTGMGTTGASVGGFGSVDEDSEAWDGAGATGLPEGGLDATRGPLPGSGAYGKVDLVDLGIEGDSTFVVMPAEGVLYAGESMVFEITFLPTDSNSRYERYLQLRVDKTAQGQAPKGYTVTLLEVGMEGLGAPLALEAAPCALLLPGSLTLGSSASGTVTLSNPSRAPAHFSLELLDPKNGGRGSVAGGYGAVSVSPSSGVVEALGEAQLSVSFTAVDGLQRGMQDFTLMCNVRHGPSIPLQVKAHVGLPGVHLVTTSLDYGLVRLKASATLPVVIRNTSDTAPCEWTIHEMLEDIQAQQDAVQAAQAVHTPAAQTPARMSLMGLPTPNSAPAVINPALARLLNGGMAPSPSAAAGPGPGPAVGSQSMHSLTTHSPLPVGSFRARCQSFTNSPASPLRHPHSRHRRLSSAPEPPTAPGQQQQQQQRTFVIFEPCSGVLGPGQEQVINATLLAHSDGQHRSIVQLTGSDGQVCCLEAFAAVVTPHATLSTPRIDLGTTFLGVAVKQSVTIKNLSLLPLDFRFSLDSPNDDPLADLRIKPDRGTLDPGESQELQLRYNPRALGDSVIFGVCDIEGAPQPTGFMVSSTIKGLDATYELMTPHEYEQYSELQRERAAGRARRRRDDVDNFAGMTHLAPDVQARFGLHKQYGASGAAAQPGGKHLVANFGAAVPLGETRHMYLVVTNRTPIHTSVRTWLDHFGVEDVSRLTEKGRPGAPPTDLRSDAASPPTGNGMGTGGVPRLKPSKYTPIKLSDVADKTAPYRTAAGNDMLGARRLQLEAEQVLGDKGLAVSVTPPESTLEAWGRLVLQVSCFNDMCGDYFDMLHVRVGEMAAKDIPVRVGVAGTPLVVQKERVLIKGLRGRTWRTGLEFGALPLGVSLERTFYVFNTGGLDMRLAWEFMRFQDDSDCVRPSARIFDLKLESLEDELPAGRRRGPGSEAASETRPSSAGAAAGVAQAEGEGGEEAAAAGSAAEGATASGDSTAAGDGAAGAKEGEAGEAGGEGATDNGQGEEGEGEEKEERGAKTREEPARPLVRMVLSPHAEADVAPFVVEPADKVIKGGDFAKFTVRFSSQRTAAHAGYLVGTQQVFSPSRPVSLKVWPEGDHAESVGTLFTGTFHPYAGSPPTPLQPLQVDLSASAISSRLEPDENTDLEWVCQSTHDPASHGSYRRTVTMSNLQTCPLLFKMHTQGPFELLGVTPSAPQDPIAYQGIVGTPSSFGDQTYLPPQQSVDVSIRFLAGSAAAGGSVSASGAAPELGPTSLHPSGSLTKSNSVATPSRGHGLPKKKASLSGSALDNQDDFSLHGQLLVTYSNGDVQGLPLHGQVLHPALELRPSSLAYRRVHVHSPKPLEVVLSNPTQVDARWSVVAAGPGTGGTLSATPSAAGGVRVGGIKSAASAAAAAAAASAAAAAASEEHGSGENAAAEVGEVRFGPFVVWPGGGLLPGRGLGLPRTQKVTVTFSPSEAADYSQALRFVVSRGRSCVLELTGTGSFDEQEEHQAPLKYKI